MGHPAVVVISNSLDKYSIDAYRTLNLSEPLPLPTARNAGRVVSAAKANAHTGDCSSGIGFALKSFLHCAAVHRAQRFDFFLRALSVEIPVPAYICRYSFDRKTKATLAFSVGVHSDLCQIAFQS